MLWAEWSVQSLPTKPEDFAPGWICAGWLAGGQESAGVYMAPGSVQHRGIYDAGVCTVRGHAQRGVTYSVGVCTTREYL